MGTKLTLGDGGWIIDRSSRARSHRLANDPHGPRFDWWTMEIGLDERANDEQTAALGAIFGGAEGAPMAAFAPLVGKHLGVKKVPIKYAINGKTRSTEIPSIVNMG